MKYTIVTAIKNHSNKERIDDKYSELIKNADLLIQYLNDPEALYYFRLFFLS